MILLIFGFAAIGFLVLGWCLVEAVSVATTQKSMALRVLGAIGALATVAAIVILIIRVCT